MTKKEAIEILIKAGVNDITGSGKGIRDTKDEWRNKVKQAIKVMWKHLHGTEMTTSEKFNNGIY